MPNLLHHKSRTTVGTLLNLSVLLCSHLLSELHNSIYFKGLLWELSEFLIYIKGLENILSAKYEIWLT